MVQEQKCESCKPEMHGCLRARAHTHKHTHTQNTKIILIAWYGDYLPVIQHMIPPEPLTHWKGAFSPASCSLSFSLFLPPNKCNLKFENKSVRNKFLQILPET